MPELPEVESIRLQLERFLVGHIINDVVVNNPRILSGERESILRRKVLSVRRYGKVLVIDLEGDTSIMAHVKMTGQFIYRGPHLLNPVPLSKKVTGGVPGPHTHIVFNLDQGGVLYFNDFRQFGWIKIVPTAEVEHTGLVGKMGPEPFKDLTKEYFTLITSKTRRPIKVVLMDQEKLAGVGNIYANDALWLSKIAPTRPSSSLTVEEKNALYEAIHSVLKEGMKYGGSSENSFVTPDGTEGEYQRHTLVYGKQGNVCAHCNVNIIIKTMIGGRGTYSCPFCQI
jgi:formamidopyrimidine-DNA glycosylase